MRLRDLKLNEAINTSAIDLAARETLHTGLLKWLQADWDHFIQAYPGAEQHDLYDAYYEWKSKNGHDLFLQQICQQAGFLLSDITRAEVRKTFGEEIAVKYESVYAFKRYLSKKTITPSMIFVEVKAREFSNDPHATYNGYFQGQGSPHIVCAVNANDVWAAAMGLVQIIAFGEGEDHDLLVNVIAPTFAHEYAHLEQMLRGDPNTGRDPGYITAGGGKRGGRRDPKNGTVGWLRYKSSAMEIEAFASGAASELIADASRHSRWSSSKGMEDSQIKDILENIALGYSSSRSLNSYTAIAWGTWTEEANRLGIPAHEMTATYRRFLKKVYAHIWNYRQARVGTKSREFGWQVNNAPPKWKKWAQKLPMRDCAGLIAQDIAEQLVIRDRYVNTDSLRRYSEEIYRGAQFINSTFFGGDDDFNDTRMDAVETSFKNLVIKLVLREQESLRDAA